jgi:hypothetical protein
MVGTGGFEPPGGGIKNRCLTTWLRPNIDVQIKRSAFFIAKLNLSQYILLK